MTVGEAELTRRVEREEDVLLVEKAEREKTGQVTALVIAVQRLIVQDKRMLTAVRQIRAVMILSQPGEWLIRYLLQRVFELPGRDVS